MQGSKILNRHLVLNGELKAKEGIGYEGTNVGGTVTQLTNRTTGVTLNKICGNIVTNNASLAAAGEASFTVTNSKVVAGDVVIVSLKTKSTTALSLPIVSTIASGSFEITMTNLDAATADTSASTINFLIIKAVAA